MPQIEPLKLQKCKIPLALIEKLKKEWASLARIGIITVEVMVPQKALMQRQQPITFASITQTKTEGKNIKRE